VIIRGKIVANVKGSNLAYIKHIVRLAKAADRYRK